MPNPSTLAAADHDEAPLSLARFYAVKIGLAKHRLGEKIAIWFAWRLPRRVALWAMVRVAAHATTGRWGNENPCDLTYAKMHDRWEDK